MWACQEHIRSIWIWIPHWHLEACEWDMMWGWPRLQSRSRLTGCRRRGGIAPSRWVSTSPVARVIILRESLEKKVGSFGNWESEIVRNVYNTGCMQYWSLMHFEPVKSTKNVHFETKLWARGHFQLFEGRFHKNLKNNFKPSYLGHFFTKYEKCIFNFYILYAKYSPLPSSPQAAARYLEIL